MTDKPEEAKPEEAKPEPKQTAVVDHVKIMLKALELAGNATGCKITVKETSRETLIYFNDGNDQTTNPTLAAYIEKAGRIILKERAPEIIEKAKDLLENEIGEIRELLG